VVIAVGPLTSVREQAAGAYAQAMAERGYAALTFDYRCFGESDGQPRQFENPVANIEDIRNGRSTSTMTRSPSPRQPMPWPHSAKELTRERLRSNAGGLAQALDAAPHRWRGGIAVDHDLHLRWTRGGLGVQAR
jgi:hypothetical protein